MTYWIGRIEPSMWFEGAWWQEILPGDVRLAVLSLGVRRLVDEDLERAHAVILEKVELLDQEGVDVINVGGSPVVSVYGKAGHERLLADIAAITDRPFVTSLQAEVEGLRHAGAGRVAIASPYPVQQTEKRAKVLAEEGFEVTGQRSLDIESTRVIAEIDPKDVLGLALDTARDNPSADVVYLPCGSLPVTGVISEVEARTGKAVVTNAQAQIAANLRRVNYPRPVHGFGRLLENIA